MQINKPKIVFDFDKMSLSELRRAIDTFSEICTMEIERRQNELSPLTREEIKEFLDRHGLSNG